MLKLTSLKSYWSKILSILLFFLLIGAYTQIFAIGEPYDPGETLDPECPPGEVNCTVLISSGGSMVYPASGIPNSNGTAWDTSYSTTGTGTVLTLATTPVFTTNITTPLVLGGTGTTTDLSFQTTSGVGATGADMHFLVGNNGGTEAVTILNNGNVGFGTTAPTSKLEIKLNSTITYNQTFSGSGLDDATFSGSYGGSIPNSFYVNIMEEGSPDSFEFYDQNGECAYQSLTPITGSPQLLCNGIYITFNSISGHLLYDSWIYNVNNNLSESGKVLNIKDNIDNYFVINAVAKDSNFLGDGAGNNATGAFYSNFLGKNSGLNATNAHNSNFLGYQAGMSASSAIHSNFIGSQAGQNATNAKYSNFIGEQAGYGATNASYSTFIGHNAGYQDVVNNNISPFSNNWSILIGLNTRTGGFTNSVLIGGSTTFGAYISNTKSNQFMLAPSLTDIRMRGVNYVLPSSQGGLNTVLMNNGSGTLSWSSPEITSPVSVIGSNLVSTGLIGTWGSINTLANSVLLGIDTGYNSTNVYDSNFIGYQTGLNGLDIYSSNFIGSAAGRYSSTVIDSSFIGNGAGEYSTDVRDSSFFIGNGAGSGVTNIRYSNFIGHYAGSSASNVIFSNFIGYSAGSGSSSANNSIFIGRSAGYADTVTNVGGDDFSILIGYSTNTGGYSNSIALGGMAVNTASNEFMIGSTTRPINTTVWTGASGTATLDTATGLITTSDERLKKNITDLEDTTLDKLINVRTVKYNWINGDSDKTNIGFLAQDLENYFPELVHTGTDDYKGVNYANMTPILVEAIREMDLKLNDYSSLDINSDKSLGFLIKKFIEDESNFFNKIFVKTVVTDGIEMKDSVTGEQYCVVITNGEFEKIKGKCGEPIAEEKIVEEEEEIIDEDINEDDIIIDDSIDDEDIEFEILKEDIKNEEIVEDDLVEDSIIAPVEIEEDFQIEDEEIIL